MNRRPDINYEARMDDGDDMGNHGRRLVQTSFETGLTQAIADRVIAMLGPAQPR